MVSTRFLNPVERSLEVLFGLIMVLVITASLDTVSAGVADVDDVLLAALGCNPAWGVIDAVMYLMTNYADRARALTVLKAIRAVTLFGAGWPLGVFTGRSGWHTGVVMMGVGGVLAAMTFVLGG